MTITEIYREYKELDKPYQGNAKTNPEELYKEVLKQLDTIGNSNPHWNQLQIIESRLKDFYQY